MGNFKVLSFLDKEGFEKQNYPSNSYSKTLTDSGNSPSVISDFIAETVRVLELEEIKPAIIKATRGRIIPGDFSTKAVLVSTRKIYKRDKIELEIEKKENCPERNQSGCTEITIYIEG